MKFWNSLAWTGFLTTAAVATNVLTPDALERDIEEKNLRDSLWTLNHIGNEHGGNRAAGLPGYNASVHFVLERVQKRFGDAFDTYVQQFNSFFEQTRRISLTGPDGEDVYVVTLQYNTATSAPEGIAAELADIPVDDVRGSGCFADQWEGINVVRKIVLIKRGVCAISDKLKQARRHGALAVVLYNNVPGKVIGSATLGGENSGSLVPVGVITEEVGKAWKARLVAGEYLTATLLVDSSNEIRRSWNVISETKEGDPNNVVMLGAHLDSVQAGAGVNDNGSGTAALLELATAIQRYTGFKNKVRFAWWGSEENGLIGSLYYGQHLSEEEANRIRFYFNYDMIGSKHPIYAVYADTDAHKTGGSILLTYLQSKGKPAYYSGFGSSSDYVAFLELGIPSSGIFSGAGTPADVCYHQACDNLDNINWEAVTINTKAAARAVAQLASSLDGIPPREKTSFKPSGKRTVQGHLDRSEQLTKVIGNSRSCGGLGDNRV